MKNLLLGDISRIHALTQPQKVAVVDESGTRLSYEQLDQRANILANTLLQLGLNKGDRVAVITENAYYIPEMLIGVSKGGLVYCGINYRLAQGQITGLINDLAPAAIIVQTGFVPVLESILPALGHTPLIIGIGETHDCPYDYEALLEQHSSRIDPPSVMLDESDVFLLIYTSGTTGIPKGVPVTHGEMRWGIWLVACAALKLRPDDVLLCGLPFYVAASFIQMISVLLLGATVVLFRFSGKGFVELTEREHVTYTHLGGTLYHAVRSYLSSTRKEYDLNSLRYLAVGARPMSREQVKEMLDFFHVPYNATHRTYGMTEATFQGTLVVLHGNEMAPGLETGATADAKRVTNSIGRPFLCEINVVDENEKILPRGELGEIVISADAVMSGYWQKPELTREVIHNGFYHTRDMGVMDEDGYLYFRGRTDYMIKSGGLFVSPVEVENVICDHPAVAEAAVIGIPDDRWDEKVIAILSLKEAFSADADEIKHHCRRHLAGYQVPKLIEFRSVLPKDGQGKIDIKRLRNDMSQ